MDGMRDALLRLVRAYTETNEMLEAYVKAGLESNKLFDICSRICEAIEIMIGEPDADLESSVTYLALTVPLLNEEHRVALLMCGYNVNHPKQPAPQIMETGAMRESVQRNGGYLYETPEGDWS